MSQACTIGFPRIGPKREMKKALESYWKGSSSQEELHEAQRGVEQHSWQVQSDAGIDLIGLDSTLYDQVLDMSMTLGLVPPRFEGLSGLDLYFAMARGHEGAQALDMSKYFNTNYHYLVPEISASTTPRLDSARLVSLVKRGQTTLGKQCAVPMIIGPITMARLATLDAIDVAGVVAKLLPVYVQLLKELAGLGVPEVQVLEPAVCKAEGETYEALYASTFAALAGSVPINFVTFYDDLGANYKWVVALPVQAVSIDFCGVIGAATPCASLAHVKEHGFPADKVLGAGVIDGRNVWADLGSASAIVQEIQGATKAKLRIQSSCSLQHVPIDTAAEGKLGAELLAKLAFAVQKLAEMKRIATGAATPGAAVTVNNKEPALDAKLFDRPEAYSQRRPKQFAANPAIPAFPTTTIGSFPQTTAIRQSRAALKAGRESPDEHERKMDCFISEVIGVQEGLGLDVLVHGEPERSDMVEYFGVSLNGVAFTEHAWVQSYGSRYVRPPIIHADVSRSAPMTVREFRVAQRLTDRPVKGMLTGPVTMLNWSFARNDVSRSTTAYQLGLAIRDEVADLEKSGCSIIQVDEPALREGLPLKEVQWQSYLTWAVKAFRLATAVAAPETQIVTHLCYSEFADILPSIDGLDADVLTIENSRSGDAMLRALSAAGYARDIGAGVYDVHSPVVPTVDFIKEKVELFMKTGIVKSDPRRIWINPDCGLKTRGWAEVLPSLRNLVSAAHLLRAAMPSAAAV